MQTSPNPLMLVLPAATRVVAVMCLAPEGEPVSCRWSAAYGSLVTATNRFKAYFSDQYLDDISSRDLSRWV